MKKGLLHRPETAVDVFKLLPEGVFCQVINNVIIMSPAPSYTHQKVIMRISAQIHIYVESKGFGECITAPIDVFLNEHNAYQPDIIYISNENREIIGDDGKIHGAPDLVVEVLSPGNANDDKVKKKDVYEKCGVKEYFIVDPNTKETISYYLKGKKFEKAAIQSGKIISRLLKKQFKF